MTVLDAGGHELEQRKLSMEAIRLREYFGKISRPAMGAVEATFDWYYFLNVVEPLGLELHLVHLDLLENQLRELEREIRERGRAHPVTQALETIPGIGPFIALLLVAEIGDRKRLPTAKHLVSYMGLAHVAGRSSKFAEFYQRLRERHGPAKAAVALARKLATISYYRWRAAEVQRLPQPVVTSSGVPLGYRMVIAPTLNL